MTAVTVLSMGGTIASTSAEAGAAPSKRGEELVDAVPELGEYAALSVVEVAQKASFDLDPATVATLGRAARDAADDGADGIVVTHGTDTMEETAYYLDLALDLDVPVVITGAQRRSDEVSPDGPGNLLVAVRAATNPQVQAAGGVYIAFDEELHAARTVTKAHTSKLGTFESPDYGPVGRFSRDSMRVTGPLGSQSVSIPTLDTDADVWMVPSANGTDARQFDAARSAGVDGIVVEGTGLGNTSHAIGDAIGEAVADGLPVVVTSRCFGGSTAAVYGTPGGGETLRRHGAIAGGDLPAQKARIKLMLALAHTDDLEAIRTLFES